MSQPTAIRDGHADARVMYAEISASVSAESDGLGIYVYGDGGYLQRPDTILTLDNSKRGSGTDSAFADVVLLLDGSHA
jgi:hypothetical protein